MPVEGRQSPRVLGLAGVSSTNRGPAVVPGGRMRARLERAAWRRTSARCAAVTVTTRELGLTSRLLGRSAIGRTLWSPRPQVSQYSTRVGSDVSEVWDWRTGEVSGTDSFVDASSDGGVESSRLVAGQVSKSNGALKGERDPTVPAHLAPTAPGDYLRTVARTGGQHARCLATLDRGAAETRPTLKQTSDRPEKRRVVDRSPDARPGMPRAWAQGPRPRRDGPGRAAPRADE